MLSILRYSEIYIMYVYLFLFFNVRLEVIIIGFNES